MTQFTTPVRAKKSVPNGGKGGEGLSAAASNLVASSSVYVASASAKW
jgi:hypothetical protein